LPETLHIADRSSTSLSSFLENAPDKKLTKSPINIPAEMPGFEFPGNTIFPPFNGAVLRIPAWVGIPGYIILQV
jgi:hypothetical protein